VSASQLTLPERQMRLSELPKKFALRFVNPDGQRVLVSVVSVEEIKAGHDWMVVFLKDGSSYDTKEIQVVEVHADAPEGELGQARTINGYG